MKPRPIIAGVVIVILATVVGWTVRHPQAQTGSSKHAAVTKEQVDRWMRELSNWGRWGKDDQLGTVNLITEAKHKQAIGLAKLGTIVSLERKPVLVPKSKSEGAGAHLEIHLNHL